MSLILSLKEIIMVFSIIARAAGALALGLATNYAAEAAKEKFLRDNADLIKKAKLRQKKVKIREAFATASANGIKMEVDALAWEQHKKILVEKTHHKGVATKVVLNDDLKFEVITAHYVANTHDVIVVIDGERRMVFSGGEMDHLDIIDMISDQRGDFILGYQNEGSGKDQSTEKNMESWDSI